MTSALLKQRTCIVDFVGVMRRAAAETRGP
jgi:hypothetical protein